MNKLFVICCVICIVPSILAYVACPSGQVVQGSSCINAVNISQCTFDQPSDLTTVDPPSLVTGRLRSHNNALVAVQQALVENREVTEIFFSNKALCNYPGPNWTKGVAIDGPSSCTDTYSAVIPWAEFYNTTTGADQMTDGCGLSMNTTDPNFIIYTGEMAVTYADQIIVNDSVRPINLTRTSISDLRYQISFPTSIQVQTTAIGSSDPRVLSAIIGQSYNPQNGKLAVQLFTSIQYPYTLSTITTQVTPSQTSSVEAVNVTCPDVVNQPCSQQWQIIISRSGNKCDFNGAYIYSFTAACQGSEANCPLDATPFVVNVTFNLATEDVCGIVTDTTHVTGMLLTWDSYDSAAGTFSEAKHAFLTSQFVYYSLQLVSDSSSLVTTTVESVTATDIHNQAQPIASGGAGVVTSYSTALVNTTDLIHFHEIQFKFDSSWFGQIPTDGQVTSTVTVIVNLDFNQGKREVRKFSMRVAPNQVQATTQVIIQSDTSSTPASPTHSSTNASSSVYPLASLTLVLLVLYSLLKN